MCVLSTATFECVQLKPAKFHSPAMKRIGSSVPPRSPSFSLRAKLRSLACLEQVNSYPSRPMAPQDVHRESPIRRTPGAHCSLPERISCKATPCGTLHMRGLESCTQTCPFHSICISCQLEHLLHRSDSQSWACRTSPLSCAIESRFVAN
jgi:hypothetical protein